MTSNNNAQLVRRVLGISWPRRFLLSVFVLVGVVGAVQIVVAALLKRQLPSPRGFFESVWGSTGTMTPGPNAHDVDPVAPTTNIGVRFTSNHLRVFTCGARWWLHSSPKAREHWSGSASFAKYRLVQEHTHA
jgi:hypothetical protein